MIVTVLNSTVMKSIPSILDIEIFPNPTAGQLFISSSGDKNVELVEVFDMQGKLLLQTKPPVRNPGIYEIDLRKYIKGNSLVLLKITETEKSYHFIVVVHHSTSYQ